MKIWEGGVEVFFIPGGEVNFNLEGGGEVACFFQLWFWVL